MVEPLLVGLYSVVTTPPVASRRDAAVVPAMFRACADDFGSSLLLRLHLLNTYCVFIMFERASALKLNASKCVIVPTGQVFCAELVAEIRCLLLSVAPGWIDFKIKDRMTYLGFVLGPGVDHDTWLKIIEKIRTTTRSIAEACLPASVGTVAFNGRVAPLVDYIGQLACPHPSFTQLQMWCVNKVLHFSCRRGWQTRKIPLGG